MASVTQPLNLTNSEGVTLTVGINVGGNRTAIVLPLATEYPTLDGNTRCYEVCQSFDTNCSGVLLDCMSEKAHITYIAAEGMINGEVPCRLDFSPTGRVGNVNGDTLPAQTGALIVFYKDVVQVPNGTIEVAKNSIPGVPVSFVTEGQINSTGLTAYGLLVTKLQNGFESVGDSSYKWFRYLKSVRGTPGTGLTPVFDIGVRGYVATQRRRIKPIQ